MVCWTILDYWKQTERSLWAKKRLDVDAENIWSYRKRNEMKDALFTVFVQYKEVNYKPFF